LRILLPVEGFDLYPSYEYILGRVIPIQVCEGVFPPDKFPVEVQPEILDILLRKMYAVYVD
jgi:hypothetical protein